MFSRFDKNNLKISLKELTFHSSSNKYLAGTFRRLSKRLHHVTELTVARALWGYLRKFQAA